MKIDINVFPWYKTEPVDCGYIDMERFDAEKCFELCNWKHWTQEKPKELYSEIGSASHGICFTNPETNELWLCKSIGWLVGNEEEILQYVKENVNKLWWR